MHLLVDARRIGFCAQETTGSIYSVGAGKLLGGDRRTGGDSEEAFARLGIDRLRRLPLRSLSAGQQRRVALARMLLADVPLWLMDEPFTNLDREGRRLVMQLVEEHLGSGGMCVMAAHQDVEINAPVTTIRLQ